MRETYEVEVKIPIDDKDKIIEEIKRAKAKKLKSEKESDMYFDHPCRSFSNTDEAVRLRRVYLDDAKDLDSNITQQLVMLMPLCLFFNRLDSSI